jgi:hypothetical protein
VKTAIALLATILLNGCREAQTAKPEAAQKAMPQDDTSEILIQYLLRRVTDLTAKVVDSKNEIIKHDNRCLDEQIAVLEGRPVHQTKADPVADAKALGDSLSADLSLAVQEALDDDAALEEHNRKHPESPWADSKDLLRLMCGECTKERAFRDSQLKEEAQRLSAGAPASRVPKAPSPH